MHGGGISVESEIGTGSTFEVRLPRTPPSRSASYAI
jgi:signal transduction histidine kinase